jgi:hypothetical protein
MNGSIGQTFSTCNSQTKCDSSSQSIKREEGSNQLLPVDFVPSCYTVSIGRGKRIAQTVGNRRLKSLAKMHSTQYAKAMNCKAAKTRIVDKIVAMIKSACADNHCEASFVRYSKGRWYMVDDSVAREKVGYQLRDLLWDKYESSSKNKVAKKQRQKIQNRNEIFGADDEASYSSNSGGTNSHDWDVDAAVVSNNPNMISRHPSVTSICKGASNQMSPISVQHPPFFHPRIVKRMSFDAIQLLNEPLLCSRDSFVHR